MTTPQRYLILLCAGAVACGVTGARQSSSAAFDGRRAVEHIRELVAIGPRPSGSPGAERARAYITGALRKLDFTPQEQSFDADTPVGRIRMVNLRTVLPATTGTGGPRLLIAGHYDTKLFREFPFVGANDGGSSAAFLLEIARVLKDRRLAMPIELVFFDGEEALVDWDVGQDNTYGSRHYVAAAQREGTLQEIRALVLVDMIGGRNLRMKRDSNSTPWLTELIWRTAARLRRPEFLEEETAIEDDHLPFVRAGIPAVDLIDLDYSAWHTAEDTLDKISAESLQAVGEVVLAALPGLGDRPGAGR